MPSPTTREGYDATVAANLASQDAHRRARTHYAAVDERDQLAAEEAERVALVVTDADVSADPEVAELEGRLVDGEDIPAEQVAEVRAAARARVRFARLRDLAANRKARRDAAQLEREQAAAAEEHARAALTPYTPVAMIPLYDDAVRAVRAYTEALDGRNKALVDLATLPSAQRHREVTIDMSRGVVTAVLPLDGHHYKFQDIGQHVVRVLNAAGLDERRHQIVDRSLFDLDTRDPAIVAEGRAMAAEPKGRRKGAA